MNLLLRLLYTFLVARLRPRVDLLGPCRTPFRVLPTDLDVLRHMNNGIYFSIMDVARVDLMIRSRFLAKLRARGWYPVAAAETIQFRRSLEPFQRFAIVTRVAGWDEKAILVEQRFVRRVRGADETVALAVVRTRFLSRTGEPVSSADLLALAGHTEPSPELPGWMARWNEDQGAMRDSLKEGVGE